MSSPAQRLAAAFAVPEGVDPSMDGRPAVGRLHAELQAVLGDLCPSVSVRLTQYLNHSFLPDATLTFSDGFQRPLFLRFGGGNDRHFGEREFGYTAASAPNAIFLCLFARPDEPDEAEYDPHEYDPTDSCLILTDGLLGQLQQAGPEAATALLRMGTGLAHATAPSGARP